MFSEDEDEADIEQDKIHVNEVWIKLLFSHVEFC